MPSATRVQVYTIDIGVGERHSFWSRVKSFAKATVRLSQGRGTSAKTVRNLCTGASGSGATVR
jgi:hypothetical protein